MGCIETYDTSTNLTTAISLFQGDSIGLHVGSSCGKRGPSHVELWQPAVILALGINMIT